MLRLEPGERIVAAFRPSLKTLDSQAAHSCQEGDCGRVSFRVVFIQSETGRRSVSLCGLHFIEAGKQYPELTWNPKECTVDSAEGNLYLRLVASKEVRKPDDNLKTVPLFHSAEMTKCPLCNVRYCTNVEVVTELCDGDDPGVIDLADAVHRLTHQITAEHITGHPSQKISICYPAETGASRKRAMTEVM